MYESTPAEFESAACAAELFGSDVGDAAEAWAGTAGLAPATWLVGSAFGDTTGLAPAGAGEAVSELTYAGIAALFRWFMAESEAGDDGDGACLALTRLFLPGFATTSMSMHVV